MSFAELPMLYSHYAPRGIALRTFLQSYSQGVTVWGEESMRTLWSAATIRVYGGGIADQRWLSELPGGCAGFPGPPPDATRATT